MNAVLSFLFIAALIGAASGLFWRNYFFVNDLKTWAEAQSYCRTYYVDLATIDTSLDYNRFESQPYTNLCSRAWIGLSRNPGETFFTTWSDGSVTEIPYTVVHDDPNKNCAYTRYQVFYTYDCTKTNNFFCYKWETNLVVVQEMMTWNEALDYCRTNYTDLINLDELTDNLVSSKINLVNENNLFWTGLRFLDGSWFWTADVSQWTPDSLPSCPQKPFACGARKTAASTWENRDCEEKLNFVCYDFHLTDEDVTDVYGNTVEANLEFN